MGHAGCTIAVRSVRFGDEGAPPSTVELHWSSRTVTLRELISSAVSAQLASRRHTPTADAPQACLSPEDVARQAADGRIGLVPSEPATSVDAEIEKALRAFASGKFFVSVNGHQPASLDETVLLTEYTEATFVRLMPLAGG